jgi:hypothetical protein
MKAKLIIASGLTATLLFLGCSDQDPKLLKEEEIQKTLVNIDKAIENARGTGWGDVERLQRFKGELEQELRELRAARNLRELGK